MIITEKLSSEINIPINVNVGNATVNYVGGHIFLLYLYPTFI